MEYLHSEQHHRFDVNPLLVGLLGVLAGAIVVAICHCIIVFCNDTQRPTVNTNIATSTASNNAGEHPTVQVIVQSKYAKEYREDLCSICLGEFKQDERVRVLPECAHIFHVTCINKWLEHHSNCPLCRASAVHPPLVGASSSPGIDRISGLSGGVE